jgi:hypothetical protein
MEPLPVSPWILAVGAGVVVFGVLAGLRRIVRKPAHELTPVDRIIATMLLGRFLAPLQARFQPAASSSLPPLPNLACPLCGAANECAPAMQGKFGAECWCTRVSVSQEALARIPDELKGKACLCRACATRQEAGARGA